MSLGNMLGGAVDIHAIIEQLKQGGGSVVIINPGAGGSNAGLGGMGAMPGDMVGDSMGGLTPPSGREPPMVSNGAPPALGPDVENPAETAAEGGIEEPQDMLGAVKAGLAKMPKKGAPKAPSKGAGIGAKPGGAGNKDGSAKLGAKKADTKLPGKKAPPKKGK